MRFEVGAHKQETRVDVMSIVSALVEPDSDPLELRPEAPQWMSIKYFDRTDHRTMIPTVVVDPSALGLPEWPGIIIALAITASTPNPNHVCLDEARARQGGYRFGYSLPESECEYQRFLATLTRHVEQLHRNGIRLSHPVHPRSRDQFASRTREGL